MKNKNYDFNNERLQSIKNIFEEKAKVRLSGSETKHREKFQIRRKPLKTAAVAALVVLISITSTFAVFNFGIIREFFAGDSSFIRQFVKTPLESVSDEHFKLTLEEILTDNHYLFMVYSVEGLTDEAIAELMSADDLRYDYDFKYKLTVSPSPGISLGDPGGKFTGTFYPAHSYEIVERRTATARYWAYYDEMENVSEEPLTLRLDTMRDDQYITVPADCNVEAKELLLRGQPYGDVSVRLSPIGITLEKGVKTSEIKDMSFTEVFFRMKNGEIKTYNQLVYKGAGGFMGGTGAFTGASGEETRCKYGARFYDTMPLSDFKSIIVGNIEYEINNPAKMSAVTLEASMYPVEVKSIILPDKVTRGVNSWLPAEEVCDKLGADMAWDGNTMTIKYRGSEVEINEPAYTYKKDGETMLYNLLTPEKPVFQIYEDELFVNWLALAESLRIGVYQDSNSIAYIEELPEPNDGGQGVEIQTLTAVTPQYITCYIVP
ncbi:MAG: DUF4179 domain-containing protein [Clostridiales bacterium]|jgi:hypothetical protein|nr:DUF4179 domain-containing protein [Clostridiales bacterium]MDR2713420.1 DUF4179 domain-containing protein [Clostridiales bacterium]